MGLLGPESQILRYTPVYQCPSDGVRARDGYVPEMAIVVARWQFYYNCGFLADNTCQALLADQLGSFSIAARFGKLSTKNTFNLNIHKNAKIL